MKVWVSTAAVALLVVQLSTALWMWGRLPGAGPAVAARPLRELGQLLLFLVGAVAMRGAGCTFNDIVDRDIDRKVERTRGRPVASGRVTRASAALFLAIQALIGLFVVIGFNGATVLLAFASLGIVALYPFVKRVSSWPQAILGLAFAWGALLGWCATFGSLGWPAALLYGAAILWTMGYDTIYALQDTVDDAIVGIGSTALYFGPRVRLGVAALYGGAILRAFAAVALAGGGVWSMVGLGLFALHLVLQLFAIAPDDPVRSLALFRSNRVAGLLLFAGLAADALRMAGG